MPNKLTSTLQSPKTKTIWQFLRYSIVGLISNGLLYIIYLGLTWEGMGYMTAMSLLYITGTAITFHANRNWTFNNKDVPLPQLIKYILTYALGYLFNLLILWLGVIYLKFQHQPTQGFAIILVAFFIFLVLKFWVFPQRTSKTEHKN